MYNVCSGVGVRLSEVIKQFQTVCKIVVTVLVDPARLLPRETPAVVGDLTKIRKETGWSPQIPIEKTIVDLMDDWREKSILVL